MSHGRVCWTGRGVIGDRTRVLRSFEGTRTRLRLRLLLPKLLKEELGEERMEGVVDEVGVVILLEGLFADDRWRGLWLKIVCRWRRTFEVDEIE